MAGSKQTLFPSIIPVGDSAYLVRFQHVIAPEIHDQVLALLAAFDADMLSGVVDVVPSYASLLVSFNPLALGAERIIAWLRDRISAMAVKPAPNGGRVVTIPVVYGGVSGPDLAEVAALVGLSPEEVIRLHTAPAYRVYFLGFLAGFPYLGGLPQALRVPRLANPRTSVAAGSVGVADEQTGVYPVVSPGGWRIIGATHVPLFDAHADPPALLQPGDTVRFAPVEDHLDDADPAATSARASAHAHSPYTSANMHHEVEHADGVPRLPWLRVVDAGLATTVQDVGRWGYARFGVSASGAADSDAITLGNALLGNPLDAAALEFTLTGGDFQVLTACVVVIMGARCAATAEGVRLRWGVVTSLDAGMTLTIGAMTTGARTYLCVAGGVAVPRILGSMTTDVRAGLGGVAGKALTAGVELWRGEAPRAFRRVGMRVPPSWQPRTEPLRLHALRVLPGPHAAEQFAVLTQGHFIVAPQSDRMGVRLQRERDDAGPPLTGGQVLSEGVPCGAIQVPPNGAPIILLADHQMTGGYHIPAVVATADLGKVAQLVPGDVVRFHPITHPHARALLRAREARVVQTQSGHWGSPVKATRLMQGFSEWYDDADVEWLSSGKQEEAR